MVCGRNINVDVQAVIEINNVTINGGTIYAGVFYNRPVF
jgi:hypothetical protein